MRGILLMKWNWQQDDWPHFTWDESALTLLENSFLRESGELSGTLKHLHSDDKSRLIVDLITNEALKTSEIEGEYLNKESVQSSILNNFGLPTDGRRVPAKEQGIADMMSSLYWECTAALEHSLLHSWHSMLMNGRKDIDDIGCYRTHTEAMQVVSGSIDSPTIHFEAPPSSAVSKEMKQFLGWWKKTSKTGAHPLPSLTRASIAHLYFVSIHPYEDGNGRIGRALSEKSLSEYLGAPTLISLSLMIESKKKDYYTALQRNSKRNDITDWIVYFSQTILDAQQYSLTLIEFLIEKTKLLVKLKGKINTRQEKVLLRMFREGPAGFIGGLSAENYLSITKTSRATATRDLNDLVKKDALRKEGELKSTRYYLCISTKGLKK